MSVASIAEAADRMCFSEADLQTKPRCALEGLLNLVLQAMGHHQCKSIPYTKNSSSQHL